MARRHRQHVNPFTLHSLLTRPPLELPAVGRRLEIDLGCGDGLFTVARANDEPETIFIGLDIRPEFIEPGVKRIAKLGLSNVRLETCNLHVDTVHLFPPKRVQRFFINFPDPFFKRRQHNRRWLNEDTLPVLVEALTDDGELIYQSDVWDPAIEALGLFELSSGLENVYGAFTFARERLVEQWTSRERACLEEGRRIWRMRFKKVVAAD